MRKSSCGPILVALSLTGLLIATAPPAQAQWLTQEIPLAPGWNGVHLRVQPAVTECAVIFSNTPVQKVYWWQRTGTGMEFDLDPRSPFPRTADWKYWFADQPEISSFGRLMAGESYLIRLPTNATPLLLRIKGRPVLNPVRWIPGEQNLVGMPASTNPAVTFSQFFSFSPDFTINSSTATVFRISGPSETPQRVWSPATEKIRGGEAYWITAGTGARDYAGPIRIKTGTASRLLDFRRSLTLQTLTLENLTATTRTVRLTHESSETPPAGTGTPPLLGKTPLLFKGPAFHESLRPLPDTFVTNIPAGASLTLSLAPDAQSLTGGVAGAAWQSLLRITDGDNAAYALPTVDQRIGVSCDGDVTGLLDPAGLWVGQVDVTHVARAPTRQGFTNTWSADGPVPVGMPYSFRVILHVDDTGTVRLLQRALLAWQPGDTNGMDAPLASTNGTLTILTDEADAETFAGLHAEARIVRISSTCFPLMPPARMAGAFGSPHALYVTIALPHDDPVNPFVHRYHPQHDNLRYDNGVATNLPAGEEAYTVTRALELHFADLDPKRGAGNRAWGVSEAGGEFVETVDGLNKTIHAKGTFRLERICRVGKLGAQGD